MECSFTVECTQRTFLGNSIMDKHVIIPGRLRLYRKYDKNALPFLVYTLNKNIKYDGQLVPQSFTYPNPNIKWQTKRDMNVGLDCHYSITG